jgi:hypothetical protein
MIIRNKFNGYGFDGTRLCHDPVSLSIAATKAGAASSAAAAALAAKTAAATTAATTAATAAAGKTAALELAKKEAITAGMKQAGTEAAKQGIAQAGQQVGVEAAKQTGVEAAKQGIFSNPTGVPPTAGGPITPAGPVNPTAPLNPAGNEAYLRASTADVSGGAKPVEFLQNTNGTSVEQAQALNNQIMNRPPIDQSQMKAFKPSTPIEGQVPEFITPDVALPGKPPLVGEGAFVKGAKATPDPGTFARAGSNAAEQGIAQMNTAPTSELMLKPTFETQFPLAPESALKRGVMEGLEIVKKYPTEIGLTTMAIGQYMNQPKYEEEDKDKYKSTVDMSGFQPSVPTQRPFTRSYEYQSYAVGGPVEQMAAMNAVGTNTGYPQAGLQTPMYSNPAMQRPQAANVVAPSADAGVNTYTGEARFASGGLSAAERREYGLSTRGQRAARGLSKSYEEMEEARQREAMKLFNESSLPTPRPISRSRTQELSSPFSAAMTEHARLAKKAKVPVVEMPKTNLGDIDTYMDIPIEAAGGGIMHGLGGYSDGGRLLRGPGDGVSDSIPAVIGKRQPARLADGEFVIPARIVSELGNGSTEAGARKLYAMMERVQNTRKKSIGKKKVAVNSKADKHLPA